MRVRRTSLQPMAILAVGMASLAFLVVGCSGGSSPDSEPATEAIDGREEEFVGDQDRLPDAPPEPATMPTEETLAEVPTESPTRVAAAPLSPLLIPAYLDILGRRGLHFDFDRSLALRVVTAFGAVFVAEGNVIVPGVWMFRDEEVVSAFQEELVTIRPSEERTLIQLQQIARIELEAARKEAEAAGASITPAGPLAGRRSYQDTVGLWESRVIPGLRHWVSAGRLEQREADRILTLETRDQIGAILALEEEGIWFARGRDKSILYSVAAPGTSQHLSMLALDIKEFENREVRSILARHGWYQTVYSDLPHFTFLGIPESELPDRGLEARTYAGRTFWVVGMLIRPRGVDDQVEVSETCAF